MLASYFEGNGYNYQVASEIKYDAISLPNELWLEKEANLDQVGRLGLVLDKMQWLLFNFSLNEKLSLI